MIEKPHYLFGGISFNDILKYLSDRIDSFCPKGKNIITENRTKIKRTVIKTISYSTDRFGETPCLLMKISAYTTNLYDGYLEREEKIFFKKENEIGSDNYFVLLSSIIKG